MATHSSIPAWKILWREEPEDPQGCKGLGMTKHTCTQRFHKKLSELKSELRKVAGCKINIQKSVTFLYTNNEISES